MIVVVRVDKDGDKVVFVIHYCVNEPINTTLFHTAFLCSAVSFKFLSFLSGISIWLVSPFNESGVHYISTYEKKNPRVRFQKLC